MSVPSPVLKLPTTMPDGKRTTKHPMLWCLQNRMKEGHNLSTLSQKVMGIRPQSLYKWMRFAEADRNFCLPTTRAMQMAAYFDVPLTLFRPDLNLNLTIK